MLGERVPPARTHPLLKRTALPLKINYRPPATLPFVVYIQKRATFLIERRNIEGKLLLELLLKLAENDFARLFVLHLLKCFLITYVMTNHSENRSLDAVIIVVKAAVQGPGQEILFLAVRKSNNL